MFNHLLYFLETVNKFIEKNAKCCLINRFFKNIYKNRYSHTIDANALVNCDSDTYFLFNSNLFLAKKFCVYGTVCIDLLFGHSNTMYNSSISWILRRYVGVEEKIKSG